MNAPLPKQLKPVSRASLSEREIVALRAWWTRMQGDEATGQDRADRATLRRCHDLTSVACTAAFGRCAARLTGARAAEGLPPYTEVQLDRLALVIVIAAHLRREGTKSAPEAMRFGRTDKAPALVSELRFQRLVTCEDPDSLFVGLRRVLRMVDGHVALRGLASDLFGWDEKVRKRWVYSYYADDKPLVDTDEATIQAPVTA